MILNTLIYFTRRIYILDGAQDICLAISSIKNSTRLWHLRLCHMSQKGLEELRRQGVLRDPKLSELEFCKYCVMRKSTRLSFDTSQSKSSAILDYIHSYVWGQLKI